MAVLAEYIDKLILKLAQAGLSIDGDKPLAYGRQLLVTDGSGTVTVNVYNGKKGISVVIGGSAGSQLKAAVEAAVHGKPLPAATGELESNSGNPPGFEGIQGFDGCWAGTDESGKGDFFGSLVVAGVRVDSPVAERLAAAGVKDSKALTDAKARALARTIREVCADGYVELEMTPGRYNTLYNQLRGEGKNLNHLLAWGHARVLEDLLGKAPCRFAIADKFADERYIQSRLMAKARQVVLIQTPKAERNVAVAAASILARDRFLGRMEAMNAKYGMEFPKGASSHVVAAAKSFAAKFGKDELTEVAKLHFKTTDQI